MLYGDNLPEVLEAPAKRGRTPQQLFRALQLHARVEAPELLVYAARVRAHGSESLLGDLLGVDGLAAAVVACFVSSKSCSLASEQ